MEWLRWLLRWLNLALVVVTIIAYLSPYVDPNTISWIPFFGLSYPFLLLTHFLFIIYWVMLRQKQFLISLLCILVGWTHFNNTFAINTRSSTTHKHIIKVMSYNVRFFNHIGIRGMKAQLEEGDKFLDIIKEQSPEILCAQEFAASRRQVQRAKTYTERVFNMPYWHRGKLGLTIFSKYPIVNKGEIIFDASDNTCIYVDVKINDTIIRVYNMHLQSTRLGIENNKQLSIEQWDVKPYKEKFLHAFGKLQKAYKERAIQAQKVHEHIQKSPYPVIVCGDMNDTPLSYTYHTLSKQLNDSFYECGNGLGTTYAGSMPALRIDYVFADTNFQILKHQVLNKTYSDHYPVISEIAW